jgi:hypothetical protein
MMGKCVSCGEFDRMYSKHMCMSCYQGNKRPRHGGRWSKRQKKWVNRKRAV